QAIVINGRELNGSKIVTDKLTPFGLDAIEGRLTFSSAGRYADGADKFNCRISIVVSKNGRFGLSVMDVYCWPHDPTRERRRVTAQPARFSIIDWLKNLLN